MKDTNQHKEVMTPFMSNLQKLQMFHLGLFLKINFDEVQWRIFITIM